MKTVADQFAETLVAAGVKRIYGIVGDSLNGLTDAVRRQGKIEWLHVRHEEVAAFAAGAEAHLTGELAVCAGSCGPGNLHLINGLFDCQRSRLPVLAIAAHIPSAEIGSDYFQETHPQILFKECSHYCELVSSANQMPRTLEIAIREAVGRSGVSVVVIPGDVTLQKASDAPLPNSISLQPNQPLISPTDADLERLAAMLNSGKRLTILCGSGCAGARPPTRFTTRRKSGLRTYVAPRSIASSVMGPTGSAERATITVPGAASRMSGRAVTPSMPGIRRSSTTASGRSSRTNRTASAPSAASPTTSARPSASSSSRITRRMSERSSTNRTRTFPLRLPPIDESWGAKRGDAMARWDHFHARMSTLPALRLPPAAVQTLGVTGNLGITA